MSGNRTFTMLKPDAIENGHMGKIIDMIIQAGFSIKAMKFTRLTEDQAKKFYEVHAERPFYGELVEYMTSYILAVELSNCLKLCLLHYFEKRKLLKISMAL